MPKHILHSAATPKWGTPADIVERARRVMGSINLDPCSSDYFNQVVQAEQHYSLDDRQEDGLALPWFGNVFCNPPGGLVREFWRKAMAEPYLQMIWVGFSLEQLALLADEPFHPMDFSICIPRKRLKFKRHDGYMGSPSHSNYIAGVYVDHDRFNAYFGELGKVFRFGGNTQPTH